MKTIGRFIFAYWIKFRMLLGYKPSAEPIPKGPYCYTPKSVDFKTGVYHINPCPYYMTINKRWNACNFLGEVTDDMVFDDQCKMCGEKQDYLDEN